MDLSPTAAILLGLFLAGWTFAAAALIVAARDRVRQARSARTTARRLATMIDQSPAIPLLVRGDGALEGPARLAAWLGLDALPRFLSELHAEDGGLAPDDLEHLRQEVRRTLKTAAPFRMAVTPLGSRRSLVLCGHYADRLVAPEGAALVWWFDHSESEAELAGRRAELGQLRVDFAAIMRLIEAAPMPMWFRGPDLALRIVNDAYVAAVGVASAAEVVRDQIELVETADGLSPVDVAGQARAAGDGMERIVQATIGGQRRRLRVRDLPLGEAGPEEGVAGFAIDIEDQETRERALTAFGAAQRTLFDRLSVGVAQFDYHRRLAYANPPLRRLFAFSAEGDSPAIDFNRFLDRAREAGRLPETGDFPAWRRELGTWFGEPDPLEQAWTLADGTHLRIVALPLPDGGLALLAEDRTERFAFSAARDILLKTRGAILDGIGEAVAIFTPDGSVQGWNRRFLELWELPADRITQHPRAQVLLAELAHRHEALGPGPPIAEAVRAATLERRAERGRIRLTVGSILDFEAMPLPDGNGLLVLREVTGSEAVAAARRDRDVVVGAAEMGKATFVAELTGRLRAGLLAIGGTATALREDPVAAGNEALGERAAAIFDQAGELEARIEALADETEGRAELPPLERAEVALLPLVTTIVRERESAIEARHLTLNLRGAQGTGAVLADARQLALALGSVLDDAIAASPRDGRIDVTLARGRGEARVAIVGETAAGSEAGSPAGEGRKHARRVIEAHGGRLQLRTGPGATRTATITLP